MSTTRRKEQLHCNMWQPHVAATCGTSSDMHMRTRILLVDTKGGVRDGSENNHAPPIRFGIRITAGLDGYAI